MNLDFSFYRAQLQIILYIKPYCLNSNDDLFSSHNLRFLFKCIYNKRSIIHVPKYRYIIVKTIIHIIYNNILYTAKFKVSLYM